MKKRVDGKNLFTDKDAMMLNNKKRGARSNNRILLCMPASLHECIAEIRFRENTTLRYLVEKSMAPAIGNPDTNRKPQAVLHLCSVAAKKIITTSVKVNQDEYNTLRAINYYWRVSYSDFLVDALIRHIVQNYGEAYPDAPGMKELQKAIKH